MTTSVLCSVPRALTQELNDKRKRPPKRLPEALLKVWQQRESPLPRIAVKNSSAFLASRFLLPNEAKDHANTTNDALWAAIAVVVMVASQASARDFAGKPSKSETVVHKWRLFGALTEAKAPL